MNDNFDFFITLLDKIDISAEDFACGDCGHKLEISTDDFKTIKSILKNPCPKCKRSCSETEYQNLVILIDSIYKIKKDGAASLPITRINFLKKSLNLTDELVEQIRQDIIQGKESSYISFVSSGDSMDVSTDKKIK